MLRRLGGVLAGEPFAGEGLAARFVVVVSKQIAYIVPPRRREHQVHVTGRKLLRCGDFLAQTHHLAGVLIAMI